MGIEFDLRDVQKFIESIDKDNQKAMRSASTRSINAMHKEAWKIAKERYNKLPKATERDKNEPFNSRVTKRVDRSDPTSYKTNLKATKEPYNAIHSVVGSRYPRNQKGIPVKSRPTVYVRVAEEKKKIGPNQFIAQPKKTEGQDVTLLLSRHEKGRMKETYSSLYDVLSFPENEKRIEDVFNKVVDEVYGKIGN